MNFCSHEPRHFPEAPRTLWGSGAVCGDARRFLEQVREWRTLIVPWLESPAAYERMSPGLIRFLVRVLGASPEQQESVLPYLIYPFPIDLSAISSVACTQGDLIRQWGLDIMLWRACIVDFLSDIWDTVGEPLFDLRECGYAVDCLFMPSPVPGHVFCPDCLERFSFPDVSGSFRGHYAICPVRSSLDRAKGTNFSGQGWL